MALAERISDTDTLAPRIGRSVSVDHAAEFLGVSRRTFDNRIHEGRLLTVRTIGRSQRVLIDSIEEASPREPGLPPSCCGLRLNADTDANPVPGVEER
jgi:excisionase family DNA binding protein